MPATKNNKGISGLSKLIRASEWWGFKLPPLLSIAYATTLLSEGRLYALSPHYLFFLLSLAIGAIYVSIINDLTDIQEDQAVGKRNRVANLSPWARTAIVAGCFAAGMAVCYHIWPDRLTVGLYACAWLAFTLYSVPPFRFKKRGILGVICDASGAHFFPSLLMVSGISYAMGVEVDYHWFAWVGVWSMSFGCRGILWHQFLDRENDIKTQIKTFAAGIHPEKFQPFAIGLFCVELIALTGMLSHLNLGAAWLSFVLYVALVIIRYRRYANVPIIVISPENKHTQVLMIDYYQTFFPVSILISASVDQPLAWVILVVHTILFPRNLIIPLRDYWMATGALYRRIRYSL